MEDDIPSRHASPSDASGGDFRCVLRLLESYGPPLLLLFFAAALFIPSFVHPSFASERIQLPACDSFAVYLATQPDEPVVATAPHDLHVSKAPSVRLVGNTSLPRHSMVFALPVLPALPAQSCCRTVTGLCPARPLPGHRGPAHYALPPPCTA